jgi:hypothetical protein
VIVRPVSTFPLASRNVAVACVPWPTIREDAVNATATVATGGGGGGGAVTVTVAEPVCPSLVATMLAVPGATALTYPVADTVAVAVLELDHVTTRPVSTFPLASRRVAVACVPCPATSDETFTVTATVATGTGGGGGAAVTVTVACPVTPSLVAVTVTDPPVIPVTTPFAETVAMATFELDQVSERPESALPVASKVVAVS